MTTNNNFTLINVTGINRNESIEEDSCKDEMSKIVNYLKYEKNAGFLYHATPIQNIPGIFKYGLVPRKDLPSLPTEAVKHIPDAERFDGHLDCNCFSLGHPNEKLLYKRMNKENSSVYVLLKIPVDYLKNLKKEDVLFFAKNAASSEYKNRRNEDFQGLEAAKSLFASNSQWRFADDPQAEVLIRGTIPAEAIIAIIGNEEKDIQRIPVTVSTKVTVRQNSRLFGLREARNYSIKTQKY